MPLQRIRMKSALSIQWRASYFFSAYILSGWLKVLLQCTCSTNEPSLGFITNQMNFHSSKFYNLAGKSLERKRIIVLSYEVTLFGILCSNKGTAFLDWQNGRSFSEKKKEIRNKCLDLYFLNHLNIPKNSVV